MKFSDIFKDSNEVNEKNIVGFLSFALMVIFALVDICTGIFGKELILQEYIYNSFLFITLGSFGISEIGKVISKNKKEKE
tara:strand:+ start:119 stop:358 length:240 start_codon:yes stop_codon:yes gene_type:complete